MASTTTQHPFAALTPIPSALPTIRDEDWRFTPLKAVTAQPWSVPSTAPVKHDAPDLGGARVVFVNGRADEAQSRLSGLPAGVTISRELAPLQQASPERPFVALNAACARAGAVIRVARNVKVEHPVLVVYSGSDGAAFTRLRLELEQGAELSVAEHFCGTGRHFLGSITEAVIGANASLKIARVVADSAQAVHVGEFNARLGRDARLVLDSIALEAEFARTELRVELDGEGSHCDLRGLALARGTALFDHQIHVDHAKPHATSRQLFRNVLDDRSRGVFSGRVIVRPGALGTDAQQQNNNLLLSDDARVDTKPMLEIYADDVKCSHGATSGQLDANAVFFLRSRGLDEATARHLLTFAFANEIIEHIAVPGVQQWLSARMGERFHGLGGTARSNEQ